MQNGIQWETTSRYEHANCGIVGIDTQGKVYDGYDGRIPCNEDDIPQDKLTKEERVELANHMIARWTKYKEAE